MENTEKKIEVVRLRARDLKTGFGNPRKIKKEKFEELKKSMEDYGDFGLFLVDEKDNVIAGNQRLQVLLQIDPDREILCKRLIGYTESELRAINIKDNTHAGEWDLNILAEWTADLNIDLGIDLEPMFRNIKVGQPMWKVNLSFTNFIIRKMGMAKPVYIESWYNDLPKDPTEAIVFMCIETGCKQYLSGVHGGQYMDEDLLRKHNIEIIRTDFDDSKDLTGNKLSILDYLMNYGYVIPKEWK